MKIKTTPYIYFSLCEFSCDHQDHGSPFDINKTTLQDPLSINGIGENDQNRSLPA